MIGLSLVAAAAPSVMQMTLAPVEAQARATNFGTAEASAVGFSGEWEGATKSSWGNTVPPNCRQPVAKSSNGIAWDITCWGGDQSSKYYQEVTRSFRLASSAAGSAYSWDHPVPPNIGSDQCQTGDEWGINPNIGYNALYGDLRGACVPQVAWDEPSYLKSDPDKWQYDIRGYADMKGYATHEAFLDT